MYTHVLRSCSFIGGRVFTKFNLPLVQKLVTRCIHKPSIVGYVLSSRNYCTNDNKDETNIMSLGHDLEAQNKLDMLLSNPEILNVQKLIELEMDLLRHSGGRVPTFIRPREWLWLLNLKSKSQRRKYFEFLWRNEMTLQKVSKKKEVKKQRYKDQLCSLNTGEMIYGLKHNSLFMRIYTQTMHDFYNYKTIMSMMFEPKIVYDLGYERHMTPLEQKNCVKQLVYAFVKNREHRVPLNLYFCNANPEGLIMKGIKRVIPQSYDADFPINITQQSYLDIFNRDELVYLTPHCNTLLTKYDPDKVYIIGAIIDKSDPRPLSLAKAKRERIQMAKFPLEQYVKWNAGSGKNLTLDQTLSIMLDLHLHKDWNVAFKHIPRRKLKLNTYENKSSNTVEKNSYNAYDKYVKEKDAFITKIGRTYQR